MSDREKKGEDLVRELAEVRRQIRELQHTELRLKVSAATPVGIGRVQGMTLEWVNDTFCRMSGYSFQELKGCSTRTLLTSDDECRLLLRSLSRDGEAEAAYMTKSGDLRRAFLRTAPSGDGTFLFTIADISGEGGTRFSLSGDSADHAAPTDGREGIFRSTLAGRLLSANQALARICGFPSPDELTRTVTDAAHQLYADPDLRATLMGLVEKEGHVRGFETRWRRRDGRLIWISMDCRAVRDDRGHPLFYEGAVEDITAGRRADETPWGGNSEFRALTENSTLAIFVVQGTKFAYTNPALSAITGYSREDLASMHFWDFISPDMRDVVRTRGFARQAGEEMPFRYDLTIITKSGEERSGDFSAALIEFRGSPAILGVVHDITERKQAEARLRESEERYRIAIEQSNDGVALVRDGRIIYVNRTFLDIFGFGDAGEILGQPQSLIVHPDDPGRAARHGSTYGAPESRNGRYEFKGVRRDGTPIYVEASVAMTLYLGKPVTLTFLRDITSKKTLESQLRQAQKMEALGTLSGGIAHDFNNILTVLIGFSNLLQRKMDEGDPLRRYVDQILASSERAARLTQSLLTFSRKQMVELKPQDLTSAVSGFEGLLRRLLTEDIAFTVAVPAKRCMVEADVSRIEQLLMNLATNARDAMPGGGELRIELKETDDFPAPPEPGNSGDPGRYAVLIVADTGTGMAEHVKERVFEPFFTTKDPGQGTGLGLSLVYTIVKEHHGSITVDTAPGRGSTFSVYFPLLREEPLQSSDDISAIPGGTESILIAEDAPEVRQLTRETLEEAGYRVIEAEDGDQALTTFVDHKDEIALLILDVVMPGKNGSAVLQEARRVRPDIKALFMSGYNNETVLRKGLPASGADFLSKPASPDELLRAVRKALDG